MHEFGKDNVETSGHPAHEVEVWVPGAISAALFGKLDRYSDNFIFGNDVLVHLGWSAEEAERKVRSFHY